MRATCGEPSRTRRILGIDPGTLSAGYGVIEVSAGNMRALTFGVIRAGSRRSLAERLKTVFDSLVEVIHQVKPDEVAIEEVFVGKSMRSAIRSGEGRGVAILAAATQGLPVWGYPPTVIKRSVTGVGSAHKSQVMEMVKTILGLKATLTSEDASDALACAICHAHRRALGDAVLSQEKQ